jgi:hypothetical protein
MSNERKKYDPKGPGTRKLQLSESGCGIGEKDAKNYGDNTTFIGPFYRDGLPGSGTSQGEV